MYRSRIKGTYQVRSDVDRAVSDELPKKLREAQKKYFPTPHKVSYKRMRREDSCKASHFSVVVKAKEPMREIYPRTVLYAQNGWC